MGSAHFNTVCSGMGALSLAAIWPASPVMKALLHSISQAPGSGLDALAQSGMPRSVHIPSWSAPQLPETDLMKRWELTLPGKAGSGPVLLGFGRQSFHAGGSAASRIMETSSDEKLLAVGCHVASLARNALLLPLTCTGLGV